MNQQSINRFPKAQSRQNRLLIETTLKRVLALFAFLPLLVACAIAPQEEGAKLRTAEEDEALIDAWYPIQSEECQLLVDSFGLIAAAIGSAEMEYQINNLDEIKKNLVSASKIVPPVLLELAQTTNEPSIREYALEAIPIFAQIGDAVVEDSSEFGGSLAFFEKMAKLTGKVPDACKS